MPSRIIEAGIIEIPSWPVNKNMPKHEIIKLIIDAKKLEKIFNAPISKKSTITSPKNTQPKLTRISSHSNLNNITLINILSKKELYKRDNILFYESDYNIDSSSIGRENFCITFEADFFIIHSTCRPSCICCDSCGT